MSTWCEILTFFALKSSLPDRLNFVSDCLNDLAQRGFAVAYATTAARPLQTYLRYFGLQLIGSTEIDGEARHLVRYSLPPPGSRGRSPSG